MPENVPFLTFRDNQHPNALAMYYFHLKQKCEDNNYILILYYTCINSFVKILYYLSCKVVVIFMVIFGVRFYDNKVVKLDFQAINYYNVYIYIFRKSWNKSIELNIY